MLLQETLLNVMISLIIRWRCPVEDKKNQTWKPNHTEQVAEEMGADKVA